MFSTNEISLEIAIPSRAALKAMQSRWKTAIRATPRHAEEDDLRHTFRKTVLRMCDAVDLYAAERVALMPFDDLRQLMADDIHWSFERFVRRVERRGAL